MVPIEDEDLIAVMARYITEEGVVDMERLLGDDLGDISVEDVMMAFIEKTTQDIVDMRMELKEAKKREEEVKLACKDIRRELVNVEITNDLLDTQLFEAEEREQIWYEIIQEEKSVIALQKCYNDLRYNEASMLLPMGNGYKPITTKEEREVLGMGLRFSSSDTELTKEACEVVRSGGTDMVDRPRSAAQLTFKSDYSPIMSMEFTGPGKCPIPRINNDIIPQQRDNSSTSFRSLSPLQEMPEENHEFMRTSPKDTVLDEMEIGGEAGMERSHNVSTEDYLSAEPDANLKDELTVRKDETRAKSPMINQPQSIGQRSDESQLNTIETPKVSEETLVNDKNDEIPSDTSSAEMSGDLLSGTKSDSFATDRKSHADEGYASQISEKISEQGFDVRSYSIDVIGKEFDGKANGMTYIDSSIADPIADYVVPCSSKTEMDKDTVVSQLKGDTNLSVQPPSSKGIATEAEPGMDDLQNSRIPDDRMTSRSMTSSIPSLGEVASYTPRAPSGSPCGLKIRRRSARLCKEVVDDGRRSNTSFGPESSKALPPVEPLKDRPSRSPTKSPALGREKINEIADRVGIEYRRAVIEGEQCMAFESQIKPTFSTSITEKRGPRLVSPQYIEKAASPSLPDIQRMRKESQLSARKSREVDEQSKPGPNKVMDLGVPSYGIAGKIARKEVLSPIPRVLSPNSMRIAQSSSPSNKMSMGDNENNQNLNSKRAVRKFIDIDDQPVKLRKRNAQEKDQISPSIKDSKGKASHRKSLKRETLESGNQGNHIENMEFGHALGSQHGIHLPVIGNAKRNTDVSMKHIPSPPQGPKPGRRRSFLPNISKK